MNARTRRTKTDPLSRQETHRAPARATHTRVSHRRHKGSAGGVTGGGEAGRDGRGDDGGDDGGSEGGGEPGGEAGGEAGSAPSGARLPPVADIGQDGSGPSGAKLPPVADAAPHLRGRLRGFCLLLALPSL